jgi:hypothetical protein
MSGFSVQKLSGKEFWKAPDWFLFLKKHHLNRAILKPEDTMGIQYKMWPLKVYRVCLLPEVCTFLKNEIKRFLEFLIHMVIGPNPKITDVFAKMPKNVALHWLKWEPWFIPSTWWVTAKWLNGAGSTNIRWP